MGELDEKESPPSETQENNDSKETDKMLEPKEDAKTTSTPNSKNSPKSTPKMETSLNTPSAPNGNKKDEKSEANGEEIVNIPSETSAPKSSTSIKDEGREVKPKKIPIGGIKMPGFFTRPKPMRTDGDGAEGELLKDENNDNKAALEMTNNTANSFIDRVRGLFSKKSTKHDEKTESQEVPPKKGLLNAIKLPIATMIPKKKTGQSDDVEMGIGPETKAGLASMETLDDSLKDQDTVDRAAKTKNDDPLEAVKPTNEKKEKEQEEEQQNLSYVDRIRMYKCSVDDLAIVAGIVIFILLVGIICVFSFSGGEVIRSAPLRDGHYIVAVTSCGPVEGLKDDGSFTFRGIPYAVPPIGDNRWKPAQPIEHIEDCWNGTFRAHNITAYCAQVLSNGSIVGNEDCLSLDVITPHIRYDNPLPVIVLIGTESLLGGSPTILRPSARYARLKDVIYVRPNFRLGPFGFLALDALSKSVYPPTSGNYGLSDILAALKWVQRNIAHFGGDPKSVVLFGHRAGGTLVSALVTSPMAKGLYARAWAASGASIYPGKSLAESERLNQEFMTQIQCQDVECLKWATAEQVLDAVPDTWRYSAPDLPAPEENSSARHEWLVLDGKILQNHPADVWSKEVGKPILVLGTTAHESHSEKLQMKNINWTAENVVRHVERSKLGLLGLTTEAIKRYNATYAGLAAMISDIRSVCPMLTVARLQPAVPFYVVTQVEIEKGVADVDADIQAIMGRYEPHTAQQRRYFSAIQQLFYHWVAHGEIQQYEPRRRVLVVEQDALSFENYPNCDFWISKDIVPRYGRVD